MKTICALAGAATLAACQNDVAGLALSAPSLPASYSSAARMPAAGQRDMRDWWQVFGDPVLSGLIVRSLGQNLTILQAKQQLIAARMMARTSRTLFMPTADISGAANAGTDSVKSQELLRRPIQLNLEVGWEMGMFGLTENTQRAAKASADMAAEDVEAARIAVTAEIASAYMHLRSLQEREAIARSSLTLIQRDGQLAAVKFRSGLATTSQIEESRMNLGEAKTEQARFQTQIDITLQQIATLLGTTQIDVSLRHAKPQPAARLSHITGRPADLLRARPDVRRAELATVSAAADIGIAQADLYPKLRLSGIVGVGGPSNGSLFGIMGGPSIQIPVFDQGRRRAVVAARQALFDEAVAAYRQSVIVAYEEASSALRAWSSVHATVKQLNVALASVQKIRLETTVLEREGLNDRSKSIGSELRVLALRKQLADAREAEALALIIFYKAIGGASPLTTSTPDGGAAPQQKG